MPSERIPTNSVPAAKPVPAKPRSLAAEAPASPVPMPTSVDPSAPSELVPALVPAMHGKAVTLPEEDERAAGSSARASPRRTAGCPEPGRAS